jgi:hypothetical protein
LRRAIAPALLGVLAAGAIAAAPGSVIAAGGSNWNGEFEALARVVTQSGSPCANERPVPSPRPWSRSSLRAIDAFVVQHGTNRWVTTGSLQRGTAWVGTRAQALRGFGALWAGMDPSDLWIQTVAGAHSRTIELQRIVTPAGNLVWRRTGVIVAVACPAPIPNPPVDPSIAPISLSHPGKAAKAALDRCGVYPRSDGLVIAAGLVPHARDVRLYAPLPDSTLATHSDEPMWAVLLSGRFAFPGGGSMVDPLCIVSTNPAGFSGFVGIHHENPDGSITSGPARPPVLSLPPRCRSDGCWLERE